MSIFNKLFGKPDAPIKSNEDFWNWFEKNEADFFNIVKSGNNIEVGFFNKLSPKLNELKSDFYYVTGMLNKTTAELVFTADGMVKNFVFVEDLVKSAPKINNWQFTALKPSLSIKDVSIAIGGRQFNSKNLFFYAEDVIGCPDEIAINVVYEDFNEKDKTTIQNGVYLFLDNFLGELDFATTVDNLKIIAKSDAKQELVPIEKLKGFLIWREKEFVEKYEGIRNNTETDEYSILEAELGNGKPVIAVVNMQLLNWDSKASHPWVIEVVATYDGKNNNGMPDERTYKLLTEIEDYLLSELKDADGYLNIGRQTADGKREIYFACNDFRKPAKVIYHIQKSYSGKAVIAYDIYKDKYWRSFNKFVQ